ncbi:thioesterase family protein [Phenylobacterium sp. LjRoot225]|uniref:acyl-CoA thioesterase n=1 Tax=Phenylobacterium sp. LjRoot225 TaxID=3342285 RepID=UPI003ECE1322
MTYTTQVKVRFGDVDAAGIVFYPRYFEMLNTAVEDWFSDGLGVSFADLHLVAGVGVPAVRVTSEFAASSVLGETLDVELEVRELGRSSCTIAYQMTCGGAKRLAGELVIVCTDLKKRKAIAWPEAIRDRIDGKTAV